MVKCLFYFSSEGGFWIYRFDMPRLSVFDLLRETNAEFIARTNWQYTSQAPIYVSDASITVQGPAIGAP